MRRRDFVGALGMVLPWPAAARAQQAGRTYRIGFLGAGPDLPVIAAGYPAFRDELRKRGFIDGRNLTIELRATPQQAEGYYSDAAALARSNVDLIVAAGAEIALNAAQAASRT